MGGCQGLVHRLDEERLEDPISREMGSRSDGADHAGRREDPALRRGPARWRAITARHDEGHAYAPTVQKPGSFTIGDAFKTIQAVPNQYRLVVESWRHEYNEERPNGALDQITPAAYAAGVGQEQREAA